MAREASHTLAFTIPIHEPLPTQYYIRWERLSFLSTFNFTSPSKWQVQQSEWQLSRHLSLKQGPDIALIFHCRAKASQPALGNFGDTMALPGITQQKPLGHRRRWLVSAQQQ